MKETPVIQLLNGCKRGDLNAQRQLFDCYQTPLFAVCLRYARDRPEAQDMLQDAFLVIFRDIHQYNGSGQLEAWLRKVTVRVALQHLRRRNPLRFAEDYNELPPESLDFQPDTELQAEAILKMVQQLPDGCRTVFNMHCIEAWPYPEIAAELGLTESSVRAQYARACKHLRRMLDHSLSCIP